MIDERIPGGSFVSPRGWKAVGSPPRKWLYIDKHTPALHNGIRKILIKDLSRFQPNLFGIPAKGKFGHYDVQPDDGPLTLAVELNDTGVPVGGTPGKDQCGEMTFFNPPARPRCEPATAAIKCK